MSETDRERAEQWLKEQLSNAGIDTWTGTPQHQPSMSEPTPSIEEIQAAYDRVTSSSESVGIDDDVSADARLVDAALDELAALRAQVAEQQARWERAGVMLTWEQVEAMRDRLKKLEHNPDWVGGDETGGWAYEVETINPIIADALLMADALLELLDVEEDTP